MTKQATVVIIPADATEPVRLESIDANLRGLQAVVGGYIEAITTNHAEGWAALGNEEAEFMDLAANERAYRVLAAFGRTPGRMLRGTVFFSGFAPEGETVDVPTNLMDKILAVPGVAVSTGVPAV